MFCTNRKRIRQKILNTPCSQWEWDMSKRSACSKGTQMGLCLLSKQIILTCPILIGYNEYSISQVVFWYILFLLVAKPYCTALYTSFTKQFSCMLKLKKKRHFHHRYKVQFKQTFNIFFGILTNQVSTINDESVVW